MSYLPQSSTFTHKASADVVEHPITLPQVVTKGVPQVVLGPNVCQHCNETCVQKQTSCR